VKRCIRSTLLLPVLFAPLAIASQSADDAEASEIPLGLPEEIPAFEEARSSPAFVRLGERLFAEKRLSVDHSTACTSCHVPSHGFSSPERFPAGAHGNRVHRAVPTLLNRALGESFGWTGSIARLEDLVLLAFSAEDEFDLPVEKALERLAADEEYVALYEAASGEGPSVEATRRALVSYINTILIGDSPVDRFIRGEITALTLEERQGMWIFESRGGCWRCHAGHGNFTDEKFHNTGVGAVDGVPEIARFAKTRDEADRGRFKTPTLRGIALTAPYMHDGSLATLEDVVELYRGGGNANANLDPVLKPLDLSDEDARNLVAFLRALSRS